MIKAVAGDALLLLITEENVELMRKGKPIQIEINSVGNPSDFKRILIDLSPSVEHARKKIEDFITPDTRIHGRES